MGKTIKKFTGKKHEMLDKYEKDFNKNLKRINPNKKWRGDRENAGDYYLD